MLAALGGSPSVFILALESSSSYVSTIQDDTSTLSRTDGHWFHILKKSNIWTHFDWIYCVSPSFACQARNKAQQNVSVQCACAEVCVGECVEVCLRVCRDILPGTELLLGGDTQGNKEATVKPDAQHNSAGQNRGKDDYTGLNLVRRFFPFRHWVIQRFLVGPLTVPISVWMCVSVLPARHI